MIFFYFEARVTKELHSFFEMVISKSSDKIFFSDLSIEQIDGEEDKNQTFGLYRFSFNHLFPDFSKYVLLISGIMFVIRLFVNSLFLTIPLIILLGLYLFDRFLRSGLFMYLIMKAGLKKHGYDIDCIKWRGQKC